MPLRNLDPRAKLCIVLVLSTLGVIIKDAAFLGGVLACSLTLLMVFNVSIAKLYSRMKRFVPLFLVLLVLQSVFSPFGAALMSIKGIPLITLGGLIQSVVVVFRILIIVSSAMLLTTCSYQEFILGLVKIGLPYEVAFMVLLAIRFLPMLAEEFADALTAVQLRGVRVDRVPWGKKLEIYKYIFMPVVAAAILRAKKVAIAMETRAFRAFPRRTFVHDISFGTLDYLAVMLSLVFGGLYYYLYLVVHSRGH